ncbi:hypothetical protein [Hyphomicrobium sulfonivorans]|uniref:hypothetical protein n=1 Tax=Hyphomicrobium sulfonivorans TaxID=121290 RepID=UPI001AEE132E|nr:hypothetical protein [Hyphomicrobium sulfonivorans]
MKPDLAMGEQHRAFVPKALRIDDERTDNARLAEIGRLLPNTISSPRCILPLRGCNAHHAE